MGRVQLACLAIFFDMVRKAMPSPVPQHWNSSALTWAMLERVRPSAGDVAELLN